MPEFPMNFISMPLAFFLSFGVVLALTPLVKIFSVKHGFVAQPAGTRWHKEPTPLMGGIAIFIGIVVGLAYFLIDIWETRLLGFVLGGLVVFVVGLWDDVSSLRPVTKLLGQIIAACIAVATGIHFNFGGYQLFAVVLTIFWIASVTNAFNLIDNMDGLCAGTACISGLVLSAFAFVNGDSTVGMVSIVIVGACLGFLLYNFPPASVFMGDSGSMLIGYAFATLSIMATTKGVGNFVAAMAIPVLVLGVPIFDTALVSFSRLVKGKRLSQGGTDHTSHRLVILGLSERQTVLLIYAFSLLLGVTAFLYAYLNFSVVIVLSVVLISGVVVFGLFLGEVKVDPMELPSALSERKGPAPAILGTNVFHKRAFVEMLLDLVSICLAFYTATLLRYEANLIPSEVARIWVTLPVTIPVKLVVLYSFGLYRSMWRHLEFVDLLHITKAVTISSAANVVAILMIWRFDGYSRSVIVIDWMLMIMLVSGLRLLFRGLRESIPGGQKNSGKRLLIIGAGDAGEMLVREMQNNPRLEYHPVGFIDDNPGKIGRRMLGIEVMGSRADLRRIIVEEQIEEVIVAIPSALEEDLAVFFEPCNDLGVSCRRTHDLI
jgi:UDP-GlcNAc:undecaprenyl-phosphate GlcNAc-1-phosphate transferase